MTGLSDIASLVLVNGQVVVEQSRPTRVDADEVAQTARAVIPDDAALPWMSNALTFAI